MPCYVTSMYQRISIPVKGRDDIIFEDMTPIFPNETDNERPGGTVAMRIVDLISPIGKGQRGMIVSLRSR